MDFQLLKQLCETPAVPGREDRMRALVKQELAPLVDEVRVDVMGNVIGHKRGNGTRRVMLAAHMDEIGFVVRYVDDKGFVRLQPVGGFDARALFAQRVVVYPRQGDPLPGVLCYATKPTHMLTSEERNKAPEIDSYFVDLCLPADQVRERVAMGDMVVMDRTCESCGEGFISKALDDRAGIFVMLETLRALKDHEVDVLAVATVQEEIGLRGAGTAAFALEPDVAIAIDVTIANDHPGTSEHEICTKLGDGVALTIMDGSLICHPRLVDHLREIAQRDEIAHQMQILPRGGTDAGAMQRSRAGTIGFTLSIPTRYLHTVNEQVRKSDLEAAVALLTTYLAEAHTRDYQL